MSEPYETTPGRLGHESFALDRSDPAYRGQAVYTARTLRAYDAVVVKLSNSLVWRCPARRILAQYNRHVSVAHFDVGPGTGYYLGRCRFPGEAPEITLLDPTSTYCDTPLAASRLMGRGRKQPMSSSRSGWSGHRSGRWR
jgi:hypothetical protein